MGLSDQLGTCENKVTRVGLRPPEPLRLNLDPLEVWGLASICSDSKVGFEGTTGSNMVAILARPLSARNFKSVTCWNH